MYLDTKINLYISILATSPCRHSGARGAYSSCRPPNPVTPPTEEQLVVPDACRCYCKHQPSMLQKPITGALCSATTSSLLQTFVTGATKVGLMFYMGRSTRQCSQQPWRKVRLATTVLRPWSGGVGRRWQVLEMRCAGNRDMWGNFPPACGVDGHVGKTWTKPWS
jgi:hypothetical protein